MARTVKQSIYKLIKDNTFTIHEIGKSNNNTTELAGLMNKHMSEVYKRSWYNSRKYNDHTIFVKTSLGDKVMVYSTQGRIDDVIINPKFKQIK